MTVNRGPGVAKVGAVGTTTLEHRLQLAGLYAENAPGVPRNGVLAQAASVLVTPRADSMSWDLVPFETVINRTASEGVYTPTISGSANVASIAAPATNSRWDLVYIKQNDTAKGDADNDAVLGVVQGTALASPSKPYGDVPSGAMVLTESRIYAGTTAALEGSNTTAQVWRHTAVRGAPIPIRNDTELTEITQPAFGQQVTRLDRNGQLYVWNGTAWRAEVEFTTPLTTDGNWAFIGQLDRRVGPDGKSNVTLSERMVRNLNPFAISTSYLTYIAGFIPAGWRPAATFNGWALITDGADAAAGVLWFQITTTGDLKARLDSGATTFAINWRIHLSGNWTTP